MRLKKPEPEPEETGVIPNQVTHVRLKDEALVAIVQAVDVELTKGRQFYALPIGQTWGIFYNGEVRVH